MTHLLCRYPVGFCLGKHCSLQYKPCDRAPGGGVSIWFHFEMFRVRESRVLGCGHATSPGCGVGGQVAFSLGGGAAQGGRAPSGQLEFTSMSEIWPWGPNASCLFFTVGESEQIVSNFNKLIQFGEQKRQKKGKYVLLPAIGPVVNLRFITLSWWWLK